MNQQKIGAFLKTLRKQKGLTQEQFAENLNVSNRTVSRWENGNNMPDIDILIQISDFYEVDLRELLDGERKSGQMNQETAETVLKAVDYSNTEMEKHMRIVYWLLFAGAICWLLSQVISHTGLAEIELMSAISDFAAGASCGTIICGLLLTSRLGRKINAFKQRLLNSHSKT